MQILKKLAPILTIALLGITPFVAFGQETFISTIGEVTGILNFVLNFLRTVFFILAAVFLILAAFKYLTAQGDEEKIKGAKTMLIYSIIAVAVALLATSVIPVIESLLRSRA